MIRSGQKNLESKIGYSQAPTGYHGRSIYEIRKRQGTREYVAKPKNQQLDAESPKSQEGVQKDSNSGNLEAQTGYIGRSISKRRNSRVIIQYVPKSKRQHLEAESIKSQEGVQKNPKSGNLETQARYLGRSIIYETRNSQDIIQYVVRPIKRELDAKSKKNLLEERREDLKDQEMKKYVVVKELELSRTMSEEWSNSEAERHGKIFERNCRLYFQHILGLKLLPRVAVLQKNEEAYKEYVNGLQFNKKLYRPDVEAEIDGHFIGPKSFQWKEGMRSIKVYDEKYETNQFRIFLKAKAALFHNKTMLNLIWSEIARKKNQQNAEKLEDFSFLENAKELREKSISELEEMEKNEKKKLIKEQAKKIAKACKLILSGMDLKKEENLPLSLFYLFNGSEPKAIYEYLDLLYAHLKAQLNNKLGRLECVYSDSETLDTFMSDYYVDKYYEKDIRLQEVEEQLKETREALQELCKFVNVESMNEETKKKLFGLGLKL